MMLKLLQSIFGGSQDGGYSEKIIRMAIERTVDGTDPWLRAVSGYRKKLRPAVIKAMEHVTKLVGDLPPPIDFVPDKYLDDLRLKSLFISRDEMKRFFACDRSLSGFMKSSGGAASRIISLLAMEKQEKVTLTEDHSGDVVVRDIRQVTVTFDGHRLIEPAADRDEQLRLLKRRAFDHLLGLALRHLSGVKAEHEELERRRELLHAKLNLLERGGWGFDQSESTGKHGVAEAEAQIGEIDRQLHDMGGSDHILDTYLEVVSDILGSPEDHLWGENDTIFLAPLGIKRSEAARDTAELTYSELRNSEGWSLVVMPISLEMEGLKRFLI